MVSMAFPRYKVRHMSRSMASPFQSCLNCALIQTFWTQRMRCLIAVELKMTKFVGPLVVQSRPIFSEACLAMVTHTNYPISKLNLPQPGPFLWPWLLAPASPCLANGETVSASLNFHLFVNQILGDKNDAKQSTQPIQTSSSSSLARPAAFAFALARGFSSCSSSS